MLQHNINEEEIKQTAEQIKELLPATDENKQLIKKALITYRQDSVYRLKQESDTEWSAYVHDVVAARVHLHVLFPVRSSCSCPADGLCKHILAVFFSLYAQVESVTGFTENWSEKDELQRSKELIRQHFQVKRPDEQSLQSWLNFFQEEFHLWLKRTPKHQQTPQHLYYGYLSILKKHAPTSPEFKSLYAIHTSIDVWLRLHELIDLGRLDAEKDFYSMNPYVEQLMNTIFDSVDHLRTYALSFSLDPFLENTPTAVRTLLQISGPFQHERVAVFMEMWGTILNRGKWVKKETELLKSAQQQEQTVERTIGLMHMDYLLKEDKRLFQQLKLLNADMLPNVLNWLKDLTNRKDWKRLKLWYQEITYVLEEYCQLDLSYRELRGAVSDFFFYLDAYFKQTKDHFLYERYLQICMPYAFTEYSQLLYAQERYAEWIEIHSLVGFSISELEKELIKQIAKEEPEALIPSYHREISLLLDQKNRSAYRESVKMLKKLRTLYHKTKKNAVWERYVQQLQDSTKRLRAFQEEMKKGKLIDDTP
ncbi:SWIM zinc finger family protein [Bacillus altitudinis MN12]|uniref:SWIM zinc finger family protein n=1 Tax=Bacillus altitudinis TaxID=293387 RepID=UPI001B827077|nr:SWIM zinc finger family protein [Bacillus altitudinis]MBR0583488.1 SWIM zinc finger family protein [Bacillus altitudinis MN12]MBR0593622.1 SWIM zinc finger family protein [Bacillus altitudinis C16B11]MBR0610700.1 SWIM zinc finger family protein [Bacillus altitudinis]